VLNRLVGLPLAGDHWRFKGKDAAYIFFLIRSRRKYIDRKYTEQNEGYLVTLVLFVILVFIF
jgi:hypothetical protein